MKNKNLLLLLTIPLLATGCETRGNSSNQESTSSPESVSTDISSTDSSKDTTSSIIEDTEMIGSGTKNDPYIISNKSQLLDFQEKANTKEYSSKYYSLTNDIDASKIEWTPIGTYENQFTGVFYGNGYTISGLEITDFDSKKSQQTYGFFGIASMAIIEGLKLSDFTIDLDVYGNNSSIYVGGIVAYSYLTSVSYCEVKYTDYTITSLQNGSSYLYTGGITGLVQTDSDEDDNAYYIDILASSVIGDIEINLEDAGDITTVTGGILAMITNYDGIFAINNCYFNGSIIGGTCVGGIVGSLYSYTSIVDSYAYGNEIIANDNTGCYAGGIAGMSSRETAVLNTYSGFNTISAAISTSAIYKSSAGNVTGYNYDDGYSNYEYYRGCALYNNYSKKSTSLTGDYVYNDATSIEQVDTTLFSTTLNYSSDYWNTDSDYPTLHPDKKSTLEDKTVTFSANYNGGVDKKVTAKAGKYSYDVAVTSLEKLTRRGYSFYGYTYDREGKIEYRYYVPINHNMTIYAGFASLSSLIGTYSVTCSNGSTTINSGDWKFDENYFYWFQNEGDYHKYEYSFNGTYIFINDPVTPISGYLGNAGGYEGSIFIYDNSTITGLEINDSSYIYTANKGSSDREIPSLVGKGYLGNWKGYRLNLTIYADCQVIANSVTGNSASDYNRYGGVIDNGSSVKISVFGLSGLGEFTYDSSNDILYSGTNLLARSEVTAIYKTSEVDLLIAIVGEKKYVVKDGALGDTSLLSGVIEDDSTITYNGVEYKITGTTLTKVKKEDPEVPETTNTHVGTWTIKAGLNTGTLKLNKDNTGEYNGNSFTYTMTGSSITFTVGDMEFVLTYDIDKQTLKGTMTYDNEDYDVSSTAYEAFKEEAENTYIGIWVGTSNSSSVTIVLNKDGTGKYGDLDLTYTVSGNTISFTAGIYEGTLTYDSTNQTLKGSMEDTDEGYTFTLTFTDYTPISNTGDDTISIASIAGTYTEKMASTSITIILNSDGTGSLNNGSTTMTFLFTVNETTGVLTISSFTDPSDYFDDLTLTYNQENKSLSGSIVQDYEYTLTITATKNS